MLDGSFSEPGGREDVRQPGPDAEGGERAQERVVRGRLQVPEDGLALRCDGKDCQSRGQSKSFPATDVEINRASKTQ